MYLIWLIVFLGNSRKRLTMDYGLFYVASGIATMMLPLRRTLVHLNFYTANKLQHLV